MYSPACRAVGTRSVYGCGRILVLLRKEVHCLGVRDGRNGIGQREELAAWHVEGSGQREHLWGEGRA